SSGFTDFSFSGRFTVELNSGSGVQNYTQDGDQIELPGGPFVRLSGYGLTINTQGESITGDFVFENGRIDPITGAVSSGPAGVTDERVLLGFAQNLRLSTSGLSVGEMGLSGVVVVSESFLAAQLKGSFLYTEEQTRVEADLELEINTGDDIVTLNSPVDGKTIDIAAGAGFDLRAQDFLIDLQAAMFRGSFTLSTSVVDEMPFLKFDFQGLEIDFGGTSDSPLLELSVSTGSFALFNEGLYGDLSGLSISGGSLDVSGSLSFQFNTLSFDYGGVSSGDFNLKGPDLDLTLGSLAFEGAIQFRLIKAGLSDLFDEIGLSDQDGFEGLEVTFADVGLVLPGGAGNVSAVNGGLVLRRSGYAAQLSGVVEIDTPDLVFSGSSALKINTFEKEIKSTVEIAENVITLDLEEGPFLEVEFEDTALSLLGMNLTGDLTLILSSGLTSEGIDEILVNAKGLSIQADLGTANYELTNLNGLLLADSKGVAGSLKGGMFINDISDASFTINTATVEFSTRNESLTKVFKNRQYNFRSANYFEMEATGVDVEVDGGAVRGDFLFTLDSENGLNTTEMVGGVTNAVVGIGPNGEATLQNGNGAFILTDAGFVLGFDGDLSLNLPDISASGAFGAEINTTSESINRSVMVAEEQINLDFAAGPFFGISAEGGTLNVGEQELTGDFVIQSRANGDLIIAVDDATTTITDGTTDYLQIDDAVGAIISTAEGAAFEISGSLSILLPNLSASGNFRVLVNSLKTSVNETITVRDVTRSIQIRAGPVVNVIGINAQLMVGEQALQGGFSFETLADGGLSIEVISASLFLTANGSTLVNVSGANGDLIADVDGSDGVLTVGSAVFNIPGISVSSSMMSVELNTRFTAVNRIANLDGQSVDLDLPAGPFVRVSVLDGSLTLFGITDAGEDAGLSGNFFFEKSDGVLVLAASEVTVAVDLDGNGGELTDGEGAFVLRQDGLAGVLKGSLSLAVSGVAAGAEIFLRINNTRSAVSETITL
ncbi:hypothetical protein OAK93_01630, partial [bacterium]|nr:hypothetical protein [bacterium]